MCASWVCFSVISLTLKILTSRVGNSYHDDSQNTKDQETKPNCCQGGARYHPIQKDTYQYIFIHSSTHLARMPCGHARGDACVRTQLRKERIIRPRFILTSCILDCTRRSNRKQYTQWRLECPSLSPTILSPEFLHCCVQRPGLATLPRPMSPPSPFSPSPASRRR